MKKEVTDEDLTTEEIERQLQIVSDGYSAWFSRLNGVTVTGYGKTASEARYNLVLRTLATAPSCMDKILERLGLDPGELNLRADFEFFSDGSRLIHLVDPLGRKQTISDTIVKKGEENAE